jgi:hypothetical protein
VVTDSAKGWGIIAGKGGMAIGNVITNNKNNGLASDGGALGFANNTIIGNNNDGLQVTGELLRVDPNACKPTTALCP